MSRYRGTGRGGANRGKAWGAALRQAAEKPERVRCEGSQAEPASRVNQPDLDGKFWVECPTCTFLLRETKQGRVPTHKRDVA